MDAIPVQEASEGMLGNPSCGVCSMCCPPPASWDAILQILLQSKAVTEAMPMFNIVSGYPSILHGTCPSVCRCHFHPVGVLGSGCAVVLRATTDSITRLLAT
ncbi:unnamed protein product [Ostreobium quekettii]|uniref:Uncharacterized protein n=1 Tax=Ostreobium quekettii TaxID=121088 RepID=A0A8S1J3T8_9CHLO|nr:unnamed protein product [Ostreobium quekettii]